MNTFLIITVGALTGACGGLWVALLTEQRKRLFAERELADISTLLAVYARQARNPAATDPWTSEELPSNVVKFGKSA